MKRSRRRMLLSVVCLAIVAGVVFRHQIRDWLSPPEGNAPGAVADAKPADAQPAEAAKAEPKPAPEPPKAATNPASEPKTPAASTAAPKPEPPKPAAAPTETPERVLAQAEELAKAGKAYEAAGRLSQWVVGDKVSGPTRERVFALLDKLNAKLIFSAAPNPESEVYVVRHGDVLVQIAKPYKVTPNFIMRINGVRDARRVRPRQRLKVMHGPFHARVDLSDFELLVLHGDRYVKRFKIGIGKDRSTPTGSFTVQSKLVNPTYYDSENGEVVAADDPKNPLGERWLGIGDGYGIHGTIEPDSIGKAESRGCIRLRADDVAEVYDFLVRGSKVVIRE